MPTEKDLTNLFHLDPVEPRIICLSETVAIAHNANVANSIAAVFGLVDQKTKKPTGKSLFVGLSPGAAVRLAKLIQLHAKKSGWPDLPDDAVPTSNFVPPKTH